VLALLQSMPVKAMAHITGGGLTENVPRSLPQDVTARLSLQNWQQPPIFDWLQQHGSIAHDEMLRTFNCGIGFTLVVSADSANKAVELLNNAGEKATIIGSIESGSGPADVQYT